MIFVFEDKKDDVLSTLFRVGYTTKACDRFVYSEGVGNIVNVVTKLIQETKDSILVFIDMAPGNKNLVYVYKKLLKLSKQYPDRFYVIPIMCSEYYLIKSIMNTDLVLPVYKDSVIKFIEDNRYFDYKIIESDDDKQYCKNYEHFCKLVLKKCVINGVSTRRIINNSINVEYGDFYNKEVCTDCRINISLYNRAILYRSNWPCIPYQHELCRQTLTKQEIYEIHVECIDEYNRIVKMLSLADNRGINIYTTIPYFKYSEEVK